MTKNLLYVYCLLTFLTIASFCQAQTVPTNGLVIYYPFNGNTQEATGHISNAQTETNLTFGSDKWGNSQGAAVFNGTTSYLTANADPALLSLQEVTLAAWIKITGGGANGNSSESPRIVAVGPTGVSSQYYAMILDQATTTPRPIWFYTNGQLPDLRSTTLLSTGTSTDWRHVAVTFSDDLMKVYIDGVLDHSIAAGGRQLATFTATGALQIGTSANNRDRFQGLVDEVRIYNRALSATEINQLFTIINSTKEEEVSSVFKVYPNPSSSGQFTVNFERTSAKEVLVLNQVGQVVQTFTTTPHERQLQIDIAKAPKGTYVLKVIEAGNTYTRLIIN